MPYSSEERSDSPTSSRSPVKDRRSRSLSRSRRSRSRSYDSEDAANPGNNLYVTGLSTRVTAGELEKYFSNEGKVIECHLVTDPRTKESRGFGFVTMQTNKDADRCIKYLNRSVLEGRLITVEKVFFPSNKMPCIVILNCLWSTFYHSMPKGSVEGHQLLEGTMASGINEDVTADGLVATHLDDDMIEIPIPGIAEENCTRHMGEGQMIILILIGGKGNAPSQLLVVVAMQEHQFHGGFSYSSMK